MSNEETENCSSETYLTGARLVLNRIRKNRYLNDGVRKIFSRNDDFTTVETCLDRMEACFAEQTTELATTKKELAEARKALENILKWCGQREFKNPSRIMGRIAKEFLDRGKENG